MEYEKSGIDESKKKISSAKQYLITASDNAASIKKPTHPILTKRDISGKISKVRNSIDSAKSKAQYVEGIIGELYSELASLERKNTNIVENLISEINALGKGLMGGMNELITKKKSELEMKENAVSEALNKNEGTYYTANQKVTINGTSTVTTNSNDISYNQSTQKVETPTTSQIELDYERIKQELVENQNMVDLEANGLVEAMKQDNMTLYVDSVEEILNEYEGKPEQFENQFGMPLKVKLDDNIEVLNKEGLLTDLYVFVNHTDNGGTKVTTIDGKNVVIGGEYESGLEYDRKYEIDKTTGKPVELTDEQIKKGIEEYKKSKTAEKAEVDEKDTSKTLTDNKQNAGEEETKVEDKNTNETLADNNQNAGTEEAKVEDKTINEALADNNQNVNTEETKVDEKEINGTLADSNQNVSEEIENQNTDENLVGGTQVESGSTQNSDMSNGDKSNSNTSGDAENNETLTTNANEEEQGK